LSAFKFFQQKKTVSFTTEPQNFKETSSQLQKSSSSIRLIKSFFNLKKKDWFPIKSSRPQHESKRNATKYTNFCVTLPPPQYNSFFRN